MRLRLAKAHSLALAGVAAAAVLVGGFLFTVAGARSPIRAARSAVLARSTPHWHDGYNHFVLTMSGPSRATVRLRAATGHQVSPTGTMVPPAGATVPAVGSGATGPTVSAAGPRTFPGRSRSALASADVVAKSSSPGPQTRAAHHSSGTPASGRPGTAGPGSSSAALAPNASGGQPWQSVAPNPDEPIVLRAGQPMSLLPELLAKFPKGTQLVRDRDGNLRAVLPPGSHYGRYSGPPVGHHAQKATTQPKVKGTEPSREPQGAKAGAPGPRSSAYPPGWGPRSAAVAASLRSVPGVRTATPVWGDRFQVTTTLSAAQVAALPGVKSVAENNLLVGTSLPATNDPDIGTEYYLANDGQTVLGRQGTSGASADFSYAWSRSMGAGVLVADIDTGVDLGNPDLAGQISPLSENFSVSPPNSDVQAQGTASGFYHGTTVDGVMVALAGNGWGGAGASPQAKVLALKCGDSDIFTDSCVYAAGEYAISEGAKVINMSFGEQESSDPTLQSLVADAQARGVLVVAAAGNWSSDNDQGTVLPAGFAASYDNVISVGATDNQDALASFSDYGATTVDLMAPGADIFTDYPTYSGYSTTYASGTSYAAPLVSSTAALLWAADSSLTYLQVKHDILSSVQAVPALSGKSVTGGRLDAQAALALVGEPVQFTFTGFDEIAPSEAANMSVNVTAQAGALPSATPLGYHLELAYNYDGQMFDVVGQQLGWSMGGSGQATVTTSSSGSVFIAPAGIDSDNYGEDPLSLTVASPGLPDGTYALVAYAAQVSAPASPVGVPQAVFFNVGQASPTPAASTTTSTVAAATTTAPGTGATTSTPGATTLPPVASTTTSSGSSGTVPTTTVLSTTSTSAAGGAPTTTGGGTPGSTSSTTSSTGEVTVPPAPSTTLGTGPMPGVASTTLPPVTTTVPPVTTTVPDGTSTSMPGPATTTSAPGVTSTAPVTTAPVTTAPVTTAAPTTAPTTTAPGSVSTTAPFVINSVAPNSLPASGGDLSVFGDNLPQNPVVMVGPVPAAVSGSSANQIDVMVGSLPAGNYAVSVYNASQTQQASLSDAVSVAGGGGGATTTTAGASTTTTTAGAASTSDPTSSTSIPTTAATTTVPATTVPVSTTGPVTTTSGAVTSTTGATGTAPSSTTTTLPTASTTPASTVTTLSTVTTTTGPGGTVVGPDGMVLAEMATSSPLSAMDVGEWPALTATQLLADNGDASGSAVDGVDV